jgi:aryl-alcohol dehydrogenase-like predicted oxidoreductase
MRALAHRPFRLYFCGQAVSILGSWIQQVALAWLLAQKPWVVPIPGTTKVSRLDENLGAASVELTADDLRDIGQAASQITVQGARYPEHLQRMTGR